MVALSVLVIIFLILLGAGLLIFITFFVLNKVFLNKLFKLMDRYNALASSIHSINFFKIEILIKNELPFKIDLNELKKIYSDVSNNAQKIHDNLMVITEEINTMNLKTALRHLKEAKAQLDQTEKDTAFIKKQYDKYTSYGDAIDNIAQAYETVFEELYNFFNTKVKYVNDFKPIKNLFISTSESLSKIPNLKLHFNFKETINILLDLRKKILTLANALDGIVKFQVIADYLKNTIQTSDLQINQSLRTIDSKDYQMVKKHQNDFKDNYLKFMKAYRSLDLKSAKQYAIVAANEAYQIKRFVFIHLNTQDLIDLSLNEINKQTISILENKDKIKQSLYLVSKYFIKDPVISKSFKDVAADIDVIEKLTASSKAITSKTYSQKLEALRQIASISKNIFERKEAIKTTIDSINSTLANIVEIVNNLNDLYIYFYQLLTLIKKLCPEDSQTKDIEALINNNLELLNDYAKQIVEQEHPDYEKISKNVINMYENVEQLTSRIRTTNLIKSYATKLYVYANRYRGRKENASVFANATKLYKAKKYDQCIELLIPFIKNIKKQKK